jgi:hypothetical protein
MFKFVRHKTNLNTPNKYHCNKSKQYSSLRLVLFFLHVYLIPCDTTFIIPAGISFHSLLMSVHIPFYGDHYHGIWQLNTIQNQGVQQNAEQGAALPIHTTNHPMNTTM